MKTCNHCQAEMPDEAEFCPACGAAQETAAEEVKEETAEQPAPAAPEVQEVPETPAEPAKKKSNTTVMTAIIAAILVVAVILVVALLPKNGSEAESDSGEDASLEAGETPSDAALPAETGEEAAHHINAYGYPSYSVHFEAAEDGTYSFLYLDENGQTVAVDEADILAAADTVVATCGDLELTNRDLMYYYDQQIYTFYSAYSYYIYYFMDTTVGLDEQLNLDGDQTWQRTFLDGALDAFQQTAALYQEAMANGFTLDEENQATLDNLEADLTDFASQYGFADAQSYLENYFGPTATVESYLEYIRIGQIAGLYANSLAEAVEISDEDLSNYYDENQDVILGNYNVEKIDKNVINVRHILIAPEDTESEDSWAEAEAEAQRILDEWLAGEATEDSFAELANAYSTDPGSNTNGGLYEEVYPGQMVDTFNDWCFADGRAVGDTGIVETDYGYHIMFFSGEGSYIYWQAMAEDLYRSEIAAQQRSEIAAKYDNAFNYSGIVLMDTVTPSVPAVEEEPAEDTTVTE